MILDMAGCGTNKNKIDIGNKSDIKISQNNVSLSGKDGT